MTPARFDVALALRRIVDVVWQDFAAIVLLGLAMLTVPRLLGALVPPASAGATILAVLTGLFAALYVTIVSHGAVARLRGHPLPPRVFVARGIALSAPGFSVALLLGAGAVVVAIVALLVRRDAGAAPLGVALAGLGLLVVVLPAVPAAIIEQLGPLPALLRAGALTHGQRIRIAAVVAVVLIAYLPVDALLGSAPVASIASPGLWLRALFDLLAWGVFAVVPGVVYAGLATAPAK